MQQSTSSEDTLTATKEFEALSKRIGVKILNYHFDNRRFADKKFIEHARENGQGLTYCGVHARFQNGIAERRIRDLQERTRTRILHAKDHWPKAIKASLWPYAMRLTYDIDNSTPRRQQSLTPIEAYSTVQIYPKLQHYHVFGCPAYVFNNHNGNTNGKWNARARLGIYIGISPRHTRSVHLRLNPLTGLVSPQYHVKFDDLFETIKNKT
jgi:hypothetical protein